MAHDPSLEAMLRASPLLLYLDRAVQDLVVQRAELRRFRPGEVVLEAGGPGDTLLVLLRGEVDVFAREGETRFRVARVGAGELLGEMAFFAPQATRSADVVAREAGVLASLSHSLYAELCHTNPRAAAELEKAVLSSLADRMEATNRTLGALMDRYRTSGLAAAVQWLGRFFGRKEQA